MPPAEPIQLNLLREWREPITPRRIARDAAGSIVVHALIGLAIWVAPELQPFEEPPAVTRDLKHSAIPLYAPKFFEPTQKAPNVGKVTRELDAANRPGSPAPRQYRPPVPSGGSQNQPLAPPVLEALNIDRPQAGQAPVPGLGTGIGTGIRAPAGPAPTTPTAPGGNRDPQISASPPVPRPSNNAPGPAATPVPPQPKGATLPPGRQSVGEFEVPQIIGNSQLPSQCANDTCSALQLLSDPQNVDFRPYLQQVLAVVKRNWLTVIPDVAKAGRRGVVVIKFYIQKNGAVSTLSISSPSGNGSMDRAAVAGMSMSNPFPPLPAGYKGDEIHLQMAFAYNTAH